MTAVIARAVPATGRRQTPRSASLRSTENPAGYRRLK